MVKQLYVAGKAPLFEGAINELIPSIKHRTSQLKSLKHKEDAAVMECVYQQRNRETFQHMAVTSQLPNSW